jgi:hypothetical protein
MAGISEGEAERQDATCPEPRECRFSPRSSGSRLAGRKPTLGFDPQGGIAKPRKGLSDAWPPAPVFELTTGN